MPLTISRMNMMIMIRSKTIHLLNTLLTLMITWLMTHWHTDTDDQSQRELTSHLFASKVHNYAEFSAQLKKSVGENFYLKFLENQIKIQFNKIKIQFNKIKLNFYIKGLFGLQTICNFYEI